MPLIIVYKDNLHYHAVQCDDIASKATTDYIKARMIYPQDFDLLELDLRSQYVETAAIYHSGLKVCEWGGATAWDIYRCIATVWPEINYHTSGRPPVIL